MQYPRALAAVLVVAAAAGGSRAQDPRADFLRDYRPHAERVRDAYTNVTCRFRTEWYADAKPYQVIEGTAKYNSRGFVLSAQTWNPNAPDAARAESVEGQNARYGFTLTNSGAGGKQILGDVKPAANQPRSLLVPMCAPYANQQPAGRSYLDLVADVKTAVVGYTDVNWRGAAGYKQIVVEFGIRDPQTGMPAKVRSGFCFRPDAGWVCVGYRGFETGSDRVELEEAYDYAAANPDGTPPDLAAVRLAVFKNGVERVVRRTTITDFRRAAGPFPDAAFGLTAFGYPEPEGLPEPAPGTGIDADVITAAPAAAGRTTLWLVVAGAVCAAACGAAVLLGRRAARRRPPTPG